MEATISASEVEEVDRLQTTVEPKTMGIIKMMKDFFNVLSLL
jgi:hypothetical protein